MESGATKYNKTSSCRRTLKTSVKVCPTEESKTKKKREGKGIEEKKRRGKSSTRKIERIRRERAERK